MRQFSATLSREVYLIAYLEILRFFFGFWVAASQHLRIRVRVQAYRLNGKKKSAASTYTLTTLETGMVVIYVIVNYGTA